MNIAIYSTQIIPSNPNLDEYGGLELIAGLQAKYFDEKGHNVNLFACKNSFFSKQDHEQKLCSDNSHLYAVGEKGCNPVEAWKTYWDTPETKKVLKEADIICDHSWNWYPYSIYDEIKNICHVEHGPNPSFFTKPLWKYPNMIAVSFNHARILMKMAPGLTWRAVQNSIPLWKYNIKKNKSDRLLWLSRIYEPKGTHRAIKIAEKLQTPIDIVGGSWGDDQRYINKIKNMCEKSQYAKYVGHVTFQQKLEYLSNAKCVIMPIQEKDFETINFPGWEWNEPFGLVTPEANAVGTPVVVSPNCGWNETMIHGYNGFHANTDEEFIYYIKKIDEIKPDNCRKIAEHFDYKIMGENYLNLFKEIIEGEKW